MSQPQMNMGGMGGPVGGAPPQQQQQQAGTPTNGGQPSEPSSEGLKRLNTYIYDYFLRNQHYDVARAMHQSGSMELITQKQSPGQRQNQPNGLDDMDTDRPKDLPEPNINGSEGGPFLQDWWFQFWDIYNSRRNAGSKPATMGYLTAQRAGQKQRGSLMGGMDPAMQQNMRNMSMMSNGMMPNDLKKAAMQNAGAGNMNPQQLAHMQRMRQAQSQQQMMQGSQMERSNSQMEMNGPRSGSPGSGDAPSPKRQRLDGNVQQMGARPGQQGQMPNSQVGPDPPSLDPAAANHTRELLTNAGIDPGAMPPEQFHLIAMQPTNTQRKSVDLYSHQMQQSTMNALNQAKSNMNKGMPPNVSAAAMGPAGTQGSPLSQAGMDASLADFAQNGAMRPGMVPNPAVAAGGQPGPNAGNHALQDYQMQLMLLEQQNKKRLLMARQEQDSMSHPGMPPGANGQFAPNMSPQGSRAGGPSPNPNEMARGTPKMQPGASPNGQMQGRASPAPGFDPSQGVPPNMRNQMVLGPNGQMMPRSHPHFAGQQQLTHGQLEMLNRQAQMMPNGTFPGGAQPMPPNMMPGQPGPGPQPGQQPGQAPPNMTPRQGNQAMPPPPAPQPNATGGTQPSSPAAAPAPPTPNQSNKAKPGSKKDNKNNKKSATKKGGQTGATPASEAEQPPTPTPATPITPMNQNSFQKQQGAPNGGMPNGGAQQQPPGQQQNQGGNGAAAPGQEPFGSTGNLAGDDQFGSMNLNMNMDFADPMANTGGDVLDNFDFDSFLNTGDDGLNGFDSFSFDTGLEAGGDGMGQ